MDQQTKQWIVNRVMWIMGVVAAALVATQAFAAEDTRVPPTNDAWKSECGSRHVAYPPRLLPPNSWRGIMEGLDRHIGVGAEAARVIGTVLQQNAGRDRGAPDNAPTLRITETAGFRHEHADADTSPALWRDPNVRSPDDHQD